MGVSFHYEVLDIFKSFFNGVGWGVLCDKGFLVRGGRER